MNNWLGFSLSPHHHQQAQDSSVSHHHQLGFASDEISSQVPAECFDLMAAAAAPDSSSSLNPNCLHSQTPPPFPVLPAAATFNSNTSTATHPHQGWNNMKDVRTINTFSCSQTPHQNQETPKLENFLGHSFADTQDQPKQQQQLQIQSNPMCSSSIDYTQHDHSYKYLYQQSNQHQHQSTPHTNTTTTTTMGLSMIKNWLRNNPQAAAAATDAKATSIEAAPPPPPVPGGAQTLSLSMSTGSSDGGKLQQSGAAADSSQSSGSAIESVPRKSIDTFGQRTSIYRGVTRHRWTGRYEAHLWDNSCRREGQTRKGRQVYLGGYDKEEKAARAYDLAALKYWGTTTTTNFPISNYEKEMEDMKHMTRQEYVASLRRKSSGFSRGASIYRGVTRGTSSLVIPEHNLVGNDEIRETELHHQHGRWQARIGRVAGNKDLYLGTFSTQEEAAEAYDIAAIKFRGLNAVTNFEISRYDVKSILESATLPIGGAAKRLKDAENAAENMAVLEMHRIADEANSLNLQLTDHEHITGSYATATGNTSVTAAHHAAWPSIAFQQAHSIAANMYPYGAHPRLWCKQEQQEPEGFNDVQHQLQLGGGTQNFLLHNLMSLDSCSNMGTNTGVCESNGPATNGSSFGVPMMVQEGSSDGKSLGYEDDGGMFGSGDAYQQQARNLYYNHQSSNNPPPPMAKVSSMYNDHQGSSCNTWIPTGVPTLAARANAMAVCHGASTFTVWNDM